MLKDIELIIKYNNYNIIITPNKVILSLSICNSSRQILLSINKRNSIKVKISGGDSNLGGDIFEYELQKDIIEAYKSEGGTLPQEQDPKSAVKLFLIEQIAEKIKKELTFKLESEIQIKKFDGNIDLNYTLV